MERVDDEGSDGGIKPSGPGNLVLPALVSSDQIEEGLPEDCKIDNNWNFGHRTNGGILGVQLFVSLGSGRAQNHYSCSNYYEH